jgi:hypothetical protein
MRRLHAPHRRVLRTTGPGLGGYVGGGVELVGVGGSNCGRVGGGVGEWVRVWEDGRVDEWVGEWVGDWVGVGEGGYIDLTVTCKKATGGRLYAGATRTLQR